MTTKNVIGKLIRAAVALALGGTLAGAASAQDRIVNVYNWSDYIDKSILSDFEAETGIKVVYDVFDSNEILETKLLAGGTGYDVVVPSATFLQRQITAGVFQKLDKSKLPNLKNMWDLVTNRVAQYDPDNNHAINYMWGTTGIGYNVAAVKARLGADTIDSWDVIFDPEKIAKFADCGVQMLDAPTEMVPAALNYLGLDPASQNTDDIQRAAALLEKVRPWIQKFNSSEYISALADGDICLAVGWSGDVLQARDRANEAGNGVEVNYAIPKEGAQMWFDMMAIPSDAPHVEEAHEFLNYIMRPAVAAKASNYIYYANGNKASQAFLNKDVISDSAIYPSKETLKNLYTTKPYTQKTQRIVTRAWTRVKSGS